MAHKKHRSKQAGIGHVKMLESKTAVASSGMGLQLLTGAKHGLPNDANATASDRPQKRRKINSNTGLEHQDSSVYDVPDTTMKELPLEVRHLSSKYDFTTMSILSSAKINDKVKKLLRWVENISFADPKFKPGIVVLHAKSEVASKLVSVVEIARQDIECHKGKWWQYSKVDGQIGELKTRSVKCRGGVKSLLERQRERAGEESQGVEEETRRPSEEVPGIVDGDEETEDAFESMVTSKEADQRADQSENSNGKKIRATPVMTIYFARVPVPGLKELYGHVLNSCIQSHY